MPCWTAESESVRKVEVQLFCKCSPRFFLVLLAADVAADDAADAAPPAPTTAPLVPAPALPPLSFLLLVTTCFFPV